ncbi:hypothetical protein D3C75_874480 [compost metagenome]
MFDHVVLKAWRDIVLTGVQPEAYVDALGITVLNKGVVIQGANLDDQFRLVAEDRVLRTFDATDDHTCRRSHAEPSGHEVVLEPEHRADKVQGLVQTIQIWLAERIAPLLEDHRCNDAVQVADGVVVLSPLVQASRSHQEVRVAIWIP